jgi:DNA-binding NarL/FixJ family response regulator
MALVLNPPYSFRIRVLLVHHHPIVRQGLRSILDREADFELTGEASSSSEAVQLARYRPPDVAVVDLQMTTPSGLNTARAIWAACPNVHVIFVSSLTAEEYVEEVNKAGAYGCVVYERAHMDLVRMMRAAYNSLRF